MDGYPNEDGSTVCPSECIFLCWAFFRITLYWPIWVVVYAFEGIEMVLLPESETKGKQQFGRILGWAVASSP